MTDTTMRTKKGQQRWCQEEKEREEEAEEDKTKTTAPTRLPASTNANVIMELTRVETELRITKILKDDLERKLDKMKDELLEAQTKIYTTSQKQLRILNYIDFLDEYYENKASNRRVVSTKFIRDNLWWVVVVVVNELVLII